MTIDVAPTKRQGFLALSPIFVFLAFYLGVSIAVGDFYKVPVSVAFILAVTWAVVTTHGINLSKRIEIFSRGAANANVLYMIWIFILAGAFASLAKSIGAIDATVALALQTLPTQLIIPGIFISACFISVSIGTSVGTVVALTPFATEIAGNIGVETPFLVAVVIGGAFFGDNLSFISDTTIAATRSQDCRMSDKFRANCFIAIPAALLTLLLYIVISVMPTTVSIPEGHNYALIIPISRGDCNSRCRSECSHRAPSGHHHIYRYCYGLYRYWTNRHDDCYGRRHHRNGRLNRCHTPCLGASRANQAQWRNTLYHQLAHTPHQRCPRSTVVHSTARECSERLHCQQHHSHNHRR